MVSWTIHLLLNGLVSSSAAMLVVNVGVGVGTDNPTSEGFGSNSGFRVEFVAASTSKTAKRSIWPNDRLELECRSIMLPTPTRGVDDVNTQRRYAHRLTRTYKRMHARHRLAHTCLQRHTQRRRRRAAVDRGLTHHNAAYATTMSE